MEESTGANFRIPKATPPPTHIRGGNHPSNDVLFYGGFRGGPRRDQARPPTALGMDQTTAPAADSAALPATPVRLASLQVRQSSSLTSGKSSGRIYVSKSLCLFSVSHPIRRWAIQAIEWKWFDRIVLFLIVTNCVFLAITDPTCPEGCSHRNPNIDALLFYAEFVFCVLFTVEMTLKVIAEGLIGHRNAYLWSMWNWLDFVVVVVGWLTLTGATSGGMSALRSVRVLRPLRTITRVRGMKVLVSSIISAIPSLANVFLLCVFFFAIFGIVGLQLFGGTLRNRCFSAVNASAVAAVAHGLGEASLLQSSALLGNAQIHEQEVVCGGDWMCMPQAELQGLGVEVIAGAEHVRVHVHAHAHVHVHVYVHAHAYVHVHVHVQRGVAHCMPRCAACHAVRHDLRHDLMHDLRHDPPHHTRRHAPRHPQHSTPHGPPRHPLPGSEAPCSCTPLWSSYGAGSMLHECEGLQSNGTARQCCTWMMPYPWGESGDPNFGILSFDSFKWSILAIFQARTDTACAWTLRGHGHCVRMDTAWAWTLRGHCVCTAWALHGHCMRAMHAHCMRSAHVAPVASSSPRCPPRCHVAHVPTHVAHVPTHFAHVPTHVCHVASRRFQGVTLEGWAYLMYAVQDGYNYYASALFFFIVVVCGSYFVINLFIAVIYDAFMQHMAGTEQVRCGVRCGVRCVVWCAAGSVAWCAAVCAAGCVAWCVACCIARCIAARACST